MTQVDIAEAKARLSALADQAAAGEEIILAKAGRPVARITALPRHEPRVPGVARHWVIDDDSLLAATEPEELDAADGLTTDSLGVTPTEPA